jgi:hypothetical protein
VYRCRVQAADATAKNTDKDILNKRLYGFTFIGKFDDPILTIFLFY